MDHEDLLWRAMARYELWLGPLIDEAREGAACGFRSLPSRRLAPLPSAARLRDLLAPARPVMPVMGAGVLRRAS